jgi:hypothetical protein
MPFRRLPGTDKSACAGATNSWKAGASASSVMVFWRVLLIQKQIRAAKRFDKREAKSGVRDMFSNEPFTNNELATLDETVVDAYWVRFLTSGMKAIDQTVFADILEEMDWMPSTLQASLLRLIASGQVINLDSTTKRSKKPLYFEKNERLQLAVAHSDQGNQ